MLALTSCTTIPDRRYAIRSIELQGNEALSSDAIEEQLASRESPKFLGVFGGVIYDHEIFNRYVLETDLQRIERYYRARGYYRARVRAGRVDYLGGRHVRVEIIVEEGPPVIIDNVEVEGLGELPESLAASAQDTVESALGEGETFDEDRFAETEQTLRRVFTDNGYAHATVERHAQVSLPDNRASVTYRVDAGPYTRFGEVTIEGLGPIPEGPVRRALDITLDDPYSEADLQDAERALLDLSVFSSVSVKPDLPRNRGGRRSDRARRDQNRKRSVRAQELDGSRKALPTSIPIKVEVEPAKLRSIRLGAGLSADTLRTDVHLTAGFEHRNLFGGLQHFLIEAVPGVVLYPTRIPTLEPPQKLLPQARLRSELREPGFLEARTNALLRLQGSIYPVLLTSDPDPDSPILGYQDARGSLGLERQYRRLYGSISHNVQLTRPFTYAGDLDPDLGAALVSYPELLTKLDLRDDAINPHSGIYAQNTLQVAGVGGDAVDIKVEPEARFYIPLGKHLTLAARGALGFLFAQNYGETVVPNARSGQPGDATRAEWVRDVQLMFLRGLFSGGPASNRGYRIREVGPHGIVPFYNPGQSSAEIVGECAPGVPDPPSRCKLPLGGFTLWEASLELRFPISGPLHGAVFSDASDVAPQEVRFRFNRLHLSLGAGARYETPLGPIRLDVGYRIPGMQAPEGEPDEGIPDEVFGLPIAVALGIGVPF